MEGFIEGTTIVLVLAYMVTSVWVICHRQTIGGSLAASAGFLCGGLVIVSVAEAVATFVCWTAVVGIGLLILGALFGG